MSKVFETTPVDATLVPLQRACERIQRAAMCRAAMCRAAMCRAAMCAVIFVLAATLGCESQANRETDTAASYRISC